MYDTYQYVYRDDDVVLRIIVNTNRGAQAVKQVCTYGELAVDDPGAFSGCPNTMCSSGNWSLPGKDQIQSVETIFSANTLSNQTQYCSTFGILLLKSKSISGFTAGEIENYGILYFRKRYYETRMEIFISRDPIGRAFNIYIYACNSPTQLHDPDGLRAKKCCDSDDSTSIDEKTGCGEMTCSVQRAANNACVFGSSNLWKIKAYKNARECIQEKCRRMLKIECSESGKCSDPAAGGHTNTILSSTIVICSKTFSNQSKCVQNNIMLQEIAHQCGYRDKPWIATNITAYDIGNAGYPECPLKNP